MAKPEKTADDWKDKYFKSLNEFDDKEREFDDKEKFWAKRLDRLTKDIISIIEFYRGQDETLDQHLSVLTGIAPVSDDTAEQELDGAITLVLQSGLLRKNVSLAADGNVNEAPVENPTATLIKHLSTLTDRLEVPEPRKEVIAGIRKTLHQQNEIGNELGLIQDVASQISGLFLDPEDASTDDVQATLTTLIDQLSLPEAALVKVKELSQATESANSVDELRGVAKRIADILADYVGELQGEIDDLGGFLHSVRTRLSEVQKYISDETTLRTTSANDREQFDQTLTGSLQILREHVSNATDVSQIKDGIDTQLNVIGGSLSRFMKAETERAQTANETTQALSAKVVKLENETEQLRETLQDAHEKAILDPLTALPNRMAYNERIDTEYSRWERNNGALSMVVIDIDHFKGINDSYGHQAGDKVLRHLADQLKTQIRGQDFLGRFGGEEFVLILPDTQVKGAVKLAESLREHIEKCKFKHRNKPVTITISCGIAEFVSGDTIETVFARADEGLYKAKGSGRNRCEVVDHKQRTPDFKDKGGETLNIDSELSL